jgi:hypothetical protein
MDGERKFIVLAVCVGVLCLTVLYLCLFLSLWEYRQWVGLSLLAVIVAPVVVYLSGRLNEQDLRRTRYRHHEETPLDPAGEPMYWHPGTQPNPHRQPQAGAAARYEGYQPQRQDAKYY